LKVYIAGPYTGDSEQETLENVELAIFIAERLLLLGHQPFIPHLYHYWHEVYHHSYRQWMQLRLSWLKECDAMVCPPGDSREVDEEIQFAKKNDINIIRDMKFALDLDVDAKTFEESRPTESSSGQAAVNDFLDFLDKYRHGYFTPLFYEEVEKLRSSVC